MGYLLGLQEYLDSSYHISIFDQLSSSKQPFEFHVHPHRLFKASIRKNLKYDLKLDIEGVGEEVLPKTYVKLLYLASDDESIRPLLKTDKKIRDRQLEPIKSPRNRYHIKNKTLFPLMKEKQVVFFTLLEGEIIKGIIVGFSRYEITVNLKGALPVTVLRHAIYDLRDKKGRCFLKSSQEVRKDWEKSALFVASPLNQPRPIK